MYSRFDSISFPDFSLDGVDPVVREEGEEEQERSSSGTNNNDISPPSRTSLFRKGSHNTLTSDESSFVSDELLHSRSRGLLSRDLAGGRADSAKNADTSEDWWTNFDESCPTTASEIETPDKLVIGHGASLSSLDLALSRAQSRDNLSRNANSNNTGPLFGTPTVTTRMNKIVDTAEKLKGLKMWCKVHLIQRVNGSGNNELIPLEDVDIENDGDCRDNHDESEYTTSETDPATEATEAEDGEYEDSEHLVTPSTGLTRKLKVRPPDLKAKSQGRRSTRHRSLRDEKPPLSLDARSYRKCRKPVSQTSSPLTLSSLSTPRTSNTSRPATRRSARQRSHHGGRLNSESNEDDPGRTARAAPARTKSTYQLTTSSQDKGIKGGCNHNLGLSRVFMTAKSTPTKEQGINQSSHNRAVPRRAFSKSKSMRELSITRRDSVDHGCDHRASGRNLSKSTSVRQVTIIVENDGRNEDDEPTLPKGIPKQRRIKHRPTRAEAPSASVAVTN